MVSRAVFADDWPHSSVEAEVPQYVPKTDSTSIKGRYVITEKR